MKHKIIFLLFFLSIFQSSYSQIVQWTEIADTLYPTAIFFDDNDSLWFATNDGKLFMKNGQSYDDHSSGIICDNVTSADIDNQVIWVGGYEALTKYDGTNYTDFIYDGADPQNSDLISYAIYDLVAKYGEVWLAMEMGEVSYYNGTSFSHYTTADGLSNSLKTCIELDNTGQVWVGGYQWPDNIYIDKFDGTSWTNYSAAEGLTLTKIHTIFEDSKGNIWAAGDKLMKFNGLIWETVSTPLTNIAAIEEDDNGNLWLGGYNGDVYIYDGNTMMYANNPVKYGFRPDGMAANKQGEMFLCMKGGVYKAEIVPGSPSLKANFTVSDDRPCPNTTIQFTDLSLGNPTSWKWYFGDGDSSSLQNPTHQYSTEHYHDVTLIVSDGSTKDTLANTNFVYVDNGNVKPTIVINASSQQVCEGDTVTFSTSNTDEGDSPSFEWFVNDTSVLVDTTGSYSYQPDDGDRVHCILTSSSPCASTNKDTSNSISLSVLKNSTPVTTITANPSNSICDGDRVSFSTNVLNAGSYPTYQWQINGADLPGETGINFSSSSLQDGDIITCIVTSSLSCATGPTSSNSITMSVGQTGQTPSITISASPSDTICGGEQVTFSSSIQYGGSSPSYQWKINGADTSGQTNSSFITSSLNDGDQVSCELTSSSGCVTTPTVNSNTIDINVAINVTPTLTISANPSGALCPGTNVQFSASPTNGGASPSYQWKVNGTNVGTNSNIYNSSILNDDDTVSCVLTSSSACATGPANSNDIVMDMSLSLDTSITVVSATTLQANQAGASYQWVYCDSSNKPVPGATNQTFTAPIDGNYGVWITQNGCAEMSKCYSIITNICKQLITESGINIYPNPADDLLYVEIIQNKAQILNIKITNTLGHIYHQDELLNSSDLHKEIIDVSEWPAGMYLLNILSGDKIKTFKLIVN